MKPNNTESYNTESNKTESNLKNEAGSTDLATDRRGHDGLSLTYSSHTYAISSPALFTTLDGKYDGPS